ncbi:MAG: hypothetical protein NZ931_06025 [Aigarchaeota archaeon]|nr:hypothetical protein [Aigarchaeota archaeon]
MTEDLCYVKTANVERRLMRKSLGLKSIPLIIAKIIFFVYGFAWTLKRRSVKSLKDVYKLFYLDFLRLHEKYVEIVRLDDEVLITRCRNPCPILNLSLSLNIDTKISCNMVSEPVCKYVLRRLEPRLVFERNYEHIRPYSDSCEETIRWGNKV